MGIVSNYSTFRKRNDSCATLFKFKKRCQLFVGTESLCGVADNFAGIAEPRPAR